MNNNTSFICIVIILILTIFTTTIIATPSVKITDAWLQSICRRDTLQQDEPIGQLTFTVSSDNIDKGFNQPVLVYDITTTSTQLHQTNTNIDSQLRLQCTFNDIQITTPWIFHQRVIQESSGPNLSLHIYTPVPEIFIPRNIAQSFQPFQVTCGIIVAPGTSVINTNISIVEITTQSPKDYTFTCTTKNCQQFYSVLTNDISTTSSVSFPQLQQQQQSLTTTQSLEELAHSVGFSSIITTQPTKQDYSINNLRIGNLAPTTKGDYWIGNVTFTASSPWPTSPILPVLTVSQSQGTSVTLIESNENLFDCYINNQKLSLNKRWGLYWYGVIPRDFFPEFQVFCTFKAVRSGSMFYVSIQNVDTRNNLMCNGDPFQCSEKYPHSGGPNPDGACIHMKYK